MRVTADVDAMMKEVESNVTGINPITIRLLLYQARYGRSLAKDEVECIRKKSIYLGLA